MGGKSGCLGPLDEGPDLPEPAPPPRPRPLLFLPPLPPLRPRPPLIAAISSLAAEDLLVRAATTVELAALEAQMLSALSKTACQVLVLNGISAMELRTTDGRDLRHIPSTVPEQ